MPDSVRQRLREVDPFRVDLVLAAVAIVAFLIELSELEDDGDRGLTLATGLIALSSLAFRRRDPVIAAVLFTAPALFQAGLGGFLTSNSTVPFVAVILLLYSIGRYADASRFPVATAIVAGGMSATLLIEAGLEAAEIFWAIFLFGLPVLAGRALRSRSMLQEQLREKAAQAEVARGQRARSAVEDERARIATELQTLVANGLSAMVVQAETVPRAVDAGDFVRAGSALAAVEETGRDALTEMRRLLGVLRRDGDGLELTPQPGLARVETLVERGRERGMEVVLRIEGDRRPLALGVDLTAYRVVEDALDAAGEQGARRAEVLLRYRPDELQLQVIDDREGDASARLPGLRDRVGLYSGHLSAGRVESGFRLRASLPLEETG
jgi:signal transduction histidine kinase